MLEVEELIEILRKYIKEEGFSVEGIEFGDLISSPASVTRHEAESTSLSDSGFVEERSTDEYQEIKLTVKRSRFEVEAASRDEEEDE